MNLYSVVSQTEDEVVFKPFLYDTSKCIIERGDDGTINLKLNTIIEINSIESDRNIDLTHSKIVECRINNEISKILSYRIILIYIYELIGNSTQIMKNTTENIKVGKHTDKGFNFIENLGISFHGNNANKTLKEIIHQCSLNNIQISLKIKLK